MEGLRLTWLVAPNRCLWVANESGIGLTRRLEGASRRRAWLPLTDDKGDSENSRLRGLRQVGRPLAMVNRKERLETTPYILFVVSPPRRGVGERRIVVSR